MKPDLIKVDPLAQDGAARVSLTDCLACSGCVTSAEAVLIQQQSVAEFQAAIKSGVYDRVVVMLSPQTIASISEHWTAMRVVPPSSTASAAATPSSSFAAGERVSVTPEVVYKALTAFLRAQGATDVVDTGSSADVALVEAVEEFCVRIESDFGRSPAAARSPAAKPAWVSPAATAAVSDVRVLLSGEAGSTATPAPDGEALAPIHAATAAAAAAGEVPHKEVVVGAPAAGGGPLPVLAGECPGWVCYAEKTCPQVLPFLSTVKSAQQIAGALIKRRLLASPADSSDGLGLDAECSAVAESTSSTSHGEPESQRPRIASSKCLVVAVMPCFDKKLEASRKDFVDDITRHCDVDMVISSTELLQWIDEAADTGTHTPSDGVWAAEQAASVAWENEADPLRLLRSLSPTSGRFLASVAARTGSGGYAEAIARGAAQRLWGLTEVEASTIELVFVQGRNADVETAVLKRPSSVDAALLSGAGASLAELVFTRAFGFRNVQGVVNRIRRGRERAHYVEVMACPRGCANGGGQVRPVAMEDGTAGVATSDARKAAHDRAALVDAALDARVAVGVGSLPLAKWAYGSVAVSGPLGEEARRLFHTRFHAVPKMPGTSGTKW